MSDLKRVSISMPADLVENLDYVSRRLGISRSAFLTQTLLDARLDRLRAVLASIPEDSSEADTRRYRGDSRDYIRHQLERVQRLQGGLFDDTTD